MTSLAVLTNPILKQQQQQQRRPFASLRGLAAQCAVLGALLATAVGAHAATVVKFATGSSNSAAVLSDGTLWTWGNNMNGQLGNGTSVDADKPVRIGTGFTQVAVGSRYMVALKADGSLWMWGHALLKSKVFYETSPVQIGSDFARLLTSDTAQKADGTVWFWGDAKSVYSVAEGGGDSSALLDPLPAGTQQMATGPYNALFVLDGGALRFVTTNHFLNTWRTGYGSTGPVDSNFEQVTLNAVTAAGVKKDGTLWQWKGDEPPASLGSGYRQVAKGVAHTVALKTDGSVWAWGSNAGGQLGTASTADAESPQLVGNGFAQIAAANQHTLALTSEGTLVAWGSNSVGQLGTGRAGATPVKPTPVVFDGTSSAQLGEITVAGPLTRQTLTARVQIGSEHLASGAKGSAYLFAFTPGAGGFTYNGSFFATLNTFDIPRPWTASLENKTTVLFTDQDLSSLAGTQIYIGYGLRTDLSAGLDEMLSSKRYQLVYTIR
ncbi:MAG: hypothetical protein V4679_17475 [Pseudomonadota bacterium]